MKFRNTLISSIVVLGSLTLVACGGGGGGGGPAPLTYTGSIAPADLDNTNSKDVSGGATSMGTFGGAAGLAGSANTGEQSINTGTSIINRAVVKAVTDRLNADPGAVGAIVNVNETTAGNCGGSININLNVDDVVRTFNGTFTFSNYCEDGLTISGTANITGTVNASGTSLSFTMTIASLVVKEQSSGYFFKAENYVTIITANSSGTSLTISISGRFYHSAYGYVLVTTPSVLRYSGASAWPYSGSIKVIEDGAPPVDSATLTAISTSQYRLDVDLGNDGAIDSTSFGLWTDL